MGREELPSWPGLLRCQPSFLLSASVVHVRYVQSCHFCSVHRLESAVFLKPWTADTSLPLHSKAHHPTGNCHFPWAKVMLEHHNYNKIITSKYNKILQKTAKNNTMCATFAWTWAFFIWATFSSLLHNSIQDQMLRRSFRNSQVSKWSHIVAPHNMRFKKLFPP